MEAVVSGGLSRNSAAKRFEVGIASAVRWVKQFEATGELSPRLSGQISRRSPLWPHRSCHHDYLMGQESETREQPRELRQRSNSDTLKTEFRLIRRTPEHHPAGDYQYERLIKLRRAIFRCSVLSSWRSYSSTVTASRSNEKTAQLCRHGAGAKAPLAFWRRSAPAEPILHVELFNENLPGRREGQRKGKPYQSEKQPGNKLDSEPDGGGIRTVRLCTMGVIKFDSRN